MINIIKINNSRPGQHLPTLLLLLLFDWGWITLCHIFNVCSPSRQSSPTLLLHYPCISLSPRPSPHAHQNQLYSQNKFAQTRNLIWQGFNPYPSSLSLFSLPLSFSLPPSSPPVRLQYPGESLSRLRCIWVSMLSSILIIECTHPPTHTGF